MLIGACFLITKSWRQPRHPSVSEQLNKFRYIQTLEYNSALQKKLTVINICKNLDRHQGHFAQFLKCKDQKLTTYYMIPFK